MKRFLRNTVLGLVVMLFLTGVLTAFNVQTVEASSQTIYIRADGSIDPPTAPISSLDNVTYTFTSNISDEIVLERDNIVVDGAGYILQGDGTGTGIDLSGRSNVTIKNTEIKSFRYGIWLDRSSNNTFRNNDASNNKHNFGVYGYFLSHYIQDIDDSNTVDGKPIYYLINQNSVIINSSTYPDLGYIALINSTNVTVEGLEPRGNGQGILLAFTANSTITKNNITNNENGIYLRASYYNTISGNNITNNENGILLYESSNNTINGNSITENNSYGFDLDLSSNNTVSGNDITNSKYGIWLDRSSNNTFRNNDASNNKHNFGVYGYFLSHYIQDIDDSNTVDGKPVYYWVDRRDMDVPLDAGWIVLINCTRITVKNVDLTNNGQGVLLAFTTNSTITKNNITSNQIGIRLDWSSNNNTISGNDITDNLYGIRLYRSSNNNTISGNDITDHLWGIGLYQSSNNKIYHNDFIYNTYHASVTAGYTNIWDDGYPSGGNYWSTHVCIGNPSNGSQPYVIDANNTDHYPFQDPSGWQLPPAIVVLSPQNTSYATSSVPLTFTISEPASWMGYSLDDQLNVSVTGNTTLSALSDGSHSLIVYANDTAGNMGSSDIVFFTVDTTPPIADAGMNQTVSEDTLVTLDGSNSTDNVDITSYTWTFMDVTTQILSGATVTYNFTTPGVYTITLNVTDSVGHWDTQTVILTVLLDTDGDGTPDVTDTDDDGDGMPDTWETENGLDTLDAADASLDPDGDGLINLQEYQGGTDPNNYFSPFPLWIAGVAVAAVVGVATVVYFLKVRKP